MVSEDQYIAYFENLAVQHKLIQHAPPEKTAFFYIPQSYDLTEIDNAIRNTSSNPMLALDSLKGRFDDAQSETYTQFLDGQFTILVKSTNGDVASKRQAMDTALKIGLDILARMRRDTRARSLFTSTSRYTMRNDNYQPVGPMELLYYGYAFTFSISCPFSYTVDGGTWLDK